MLASNPGIMRSENPATKHQTTSNEKNFNQATESTAAGVDVGVDVGADVGVDVAVGVGVDVGADVAAEVGAGVTADAWADVAALKSGNAVPVTSPETKKK